MPLLLSVEPYIHAVGDVGKFEALRRVASTGAVLTAPQFEWVQRAFNGRVIISSGSGGTDIFGACVCSHFTFIFHLHLTGMQSCFPSQRTPSTRASYKARRLVWPSEFSTTLARISRKVAWQASSSARDPTHHSRCASGVTTRAAQSSSRHTTPRIQACGITATLLR